MAISIELEHTYIGHDHTDAMNVQISQAVSLKRIADTLETMEKKMDSFMTAFTKAIEPDKHGLKS